MEREQATGSRSHETIWGRAFQTEGTAKEEARGGNETSTQEGQGIGGMDSWRR